MRRVLDHITYDFMRHKKNGEKMKKKLSGFFCEKTVF